jgi:hypothetical protein
MPGQAGREESVGASRSAHRELIDIVNSWKVPFQKLANLRTADRADVVGDGGNEREDDADARRRTACSACPAGTPQAVPNAAAAAVHASRVYHVVNAPPHSTGNRPCPPLNLGITAPQGRSQHEFGRELDDLPRWHDREDERHERHQGRGYHRTSSPERIAPPRCGPGVRPSQGCSKCLPRASATPLAERDRDERLSRGGGGTETAA